FSSTETTLSASNFSDTVVSPLTMDSPHCLSSAMSASVSSAACAAAANMTRNVATVTRIVFILTLPSDAVLLHRIPPTWGAAYDSHCGCVDTDGRIHCASLRRPHYRPHLVQLQPLPGSFLIQYPTPCPAYP